ncbi:MAG: M48 family metalloprotease [Chloroflexota bacterium]|nr:MAG: M48 family metalloprotease [Chloroflexota bacterium]
MWQQIRSNQTRSAVLTIFMGALLLLLGYFLGWYFFDSGTVGLIFALILWVIMSLVAYFQGDSILLAMSGAKKISHDDHPRLYNIVEEMKIASGLEAMPSIYIIDDQSMNAFATGRDPKKASVTVTSGLLQNLNRDELQGVVGHEMSHIKNRDVLLMAMCSVLLGTIVILAWYASRFMLFGGMGRTRRSSSGGGSGQIIIIIVAIAFMILAPIMAQLIYLAISRKREYLADASSALYTRYPEGLASALEKLATSTDQLKSANQATAPMYIINPFRKKGRAAENLTSTHPPISERIRILRSMAGASFADYATSYQQVRHTSKTLIPAAALAATGTVALRAPQPEAPAKLDQVQQTRETSNLMWNLNKYNTITCACGTKLRLPPGFKLPQVRCPHCGRINPV